MRVIIVDDEVTSSQVLEKLIVQNVPSLEVVAICNKASDALQKIPALKPDLVFMDVELPGMTGFDILENIPNITFDVIFTTAHSQYGIKAIQFSAIDYLLKPINVEELIEAVRRVREHKENTKPLDKIKLLLENIQLLNANDSFNRIAFPTGEGLKFLHANDILRCQSSNNTFIYQTSGDKMLVSKSLKEIESILPSQFFCRVHNSHLINISYVSKLLKGESNMLVMKDGTEVEVSRRKKEELVKLMNLK
jgi:two-component system, LytTR family, response regulator